MKRLLNEPLLHFLVLGVLLFVGYGLLHRRGEPEARRIVVTQGKIEHLWASFSRVWQRPPSPDELDGVIQDYVREKVLAREAMALGLDRDDTVIRRRLRQKMEFVANDLAAQAEPSDEELQEYLVQHPDLFRREQRLTFRQVYLDPKRRGDGVQQDAARLLAELNQAGVHLVFLEERTDGELPELQEIHQAVAREWANAHRLETNERFYQELLRRYTVTIERRPTAVETKTPTEQVRR